MDFFGRFVDKTLASRLDMIAGKSFERINYTDAVKVLLESKREFQFNVEWGLNLQAEHERFLTEEHFHAPVTVHDYPAKIKPFYMRANDDGDTVAAMDLLVPGVGELVGGSQREDRMDRLEQTMSSHGLEPEPYRWYLDLRRYGSVPHAGFGLGFERMVMYLTGVENIRDVIPFPRVPGNAGF